jgi:hypothetical protein
MHADDVIETLFHNRSFTYIPVLNCAQTENVLLTLSAGCIFVGRVFDHAEAGVFVTDT